MINTFSNYYDYGRTLIVSVTAAIVSFLSPISFSVFSLVLLFSANALVGLMADICDGGSWNKTKIKHAFIEALLIYAFIFFVFGIGSLMRNMAGALQCVSTFTWVVIWYYGTNILRNLITIAPQDSGAQKAFRFAYFWLSVEFVKKIPGLANYNNQEKLNIN